MYLPAAPWPPPHTAGHLAGWHRATTTSEDQMSGDGWVSVDGNEAAARVAHRLNEVVAIYPITPASPMGELADTWSAAGRPNL